MSEIKDDKFYLYFIVRSVLMGLMGTVVLSVILSLVKTSKLFYVLSASLASFFIVLFITRMLDAQTKRLVEAILEQLNKWPRVKNFILENF